MEKEFQRITGRFSHKTSMHPACTIDVSAWGGPCITKYFISVAARPLQASSYADFKISMRPARGLASNKALQTAFCNDSSSASIT